MSQVKAKKKLHYYQGYEIANSEYRVNEILNLRDIDNLFDDIDGDSELGLPLLSPLHKTTGINGQKKSGSSSDLEKMSSSKQVPEVALIQENVIEENEIIDEESPFKGIAPVKTSSPIGLETESDETLDGVRPVADPLLFGVEDEEPIGGDLSKASCTQQSEAVKESLYEDSGSLASPPEKLELRKTTRLNAGSLSSLKTAKTSVQPDQSSPPEIMDNDPNQLSPVLDWESEPKPQAEQSKNQVVENSGKGLSFQHNLKKALMPKSPCSRKQAAVPAAPPAEDLEEDFMILDDEAPVLFVIPRKADSSKNKRAGQADTAMENVLTESLSPHQFSQSETDSTHQHGTDAKRNQAQIESSKQKPKGKRGKASKKSGKDSVTHDGVEDGSDPIPEVVEDRVCDQTSTQDVQGHKAVPAGKKRANSKTNVPAELLNKDGTDTGGRQEILVPGSKTTKKSSKSSEQERVESKGKKKSNKVTAAADLLSTNGNKNRKSRKKEDSVSKTKKQTSKQQTELEQVHPSCEEQEHDPSPAFIEQEEEQRTAKKDAVEPSKKQMRKQTKTVEPKSKDPPTMESDISSDSPLCVKRKRKPPGEWWLTSPNESASDLQLKQALGTTQRTKAGTKTSAKQADAVASNETQSPMPVQGNQKKQRTPNVLGSDKKLNAGANRLDAKAEKKTTKKGGRRKTKLKTHQPQVTSPAPVSGEEMEACRNENSVEISPEFCSPNRQHSILSGEKRVFDLVYSRDTGSACKPSSSLGRPEISEPDNVPQKRQRKAPSNWWEAPQSQEPADGLPPPCSPPLQKSKHIPSKVSNTPLRGVSKDGNSRKSKNNTRNIGKKNINTPKSIKRSLASMNAIFASEKPENMIKNGQRCRKQGRRNLLHSLEDQSDHSSENMAQNDDQLQRIGRSSFGFTSGVTVEPSATRNKTSVIVSSGPNTLSEVDVAFRSGPSSMLELQQHDEEDDDVDLPSSRVVPHVRQAPRVLAHCDLCGPPLQPVVLEEEDWNNLLTWFSHLWPSASKNGRVISPDDFHWHSHGDRAMGHMVDLQSHSFSHGKILLGSFMNKPPQVDLDIVSVFSIISSCVRVDIEGVKSVYNSGQVFMIPSGQMYSIHNLCQEPAVLIYHRTHSADT